MQATEASTLFQTDSAIAQGQARALKASFTSSGAEYGSPIWLGSRYKDSVGLAESGAAADAGSARVLSLRCRTVSAAGGAPQSQVWTAESGGVVRCTDLETGTTLALFRGHTAPVPTFDLVTLPTGAQGGRRATREVLLTGSWDKSIIVWPVPPALSTSSAPPPSPTTSSSSSAGSSNGILRPRPLVKLDDAASDFIKAVHSFRSEGQSFLLSAGSDKTVRCWHLSPLLDWIQALREDQWASICSAGSNGHSLGAAPKPELVATLREHTRPVNCLASVPPAPLPPADIHVQEAPSSTASDEADRRQATLFSADSMGRIFELVLDLSPDPTASSSSSSSAYASSLRGKLTIRRELRAHETSIYDMRAGWRQDEIEGLDSLPSPSETLATPRDEFETAIFESHDGSFRRHVAELWTCSGDKSARQFVLSTSLHARKAAGTAASAGAGMVLGSRNSKAGPPLGFQPPLGPTKTIEQRDFVKSLVPLSHAGAREDVVDLSRAALGLAVPEALDLLVTGSSDEMVRLFSLSPSDPAEAAGGSVKLLNELEGHWHEVEAMDFWLRPMGGPLPVTSEGDQDGKDGEQQHQQPGPQAPAHASTVAAAEYWIVTSGLDGSVRRWRVRDQLVPRPPKAAAAGSTGTSQTTAAGNAQKSVKQVPLAHPVVGAAAAPSNGKAKPAGTKQQPVQMTEDEERELAELMGSDDEDL